jgi:protein-serine/threonine kinase
LSEIYLALEFLHRNKVVFRDLKPENLMLDASGHVRLIDFGLSKVGLDYEGVETTRTVCGTSSYMAPEVIRHSFLHLL